MSIRSRLNPIPACLAASLALASASGEAADRPVTSCGDNGSGSLRAAIAAATSGDTVVFDTSSMNCSTITLTTGSLVVTAADLVLAGPGAGLLSIDANRVSQVFDHEGQGTLTVQGLTVANGYVAGPVVRGGCIYSSGSVTLVDSVVSGCVAREKGAGYAAGGGIYASGDLHAAHSSITNCAAYKDTLPEGTLMGSIGGGASAASVDLQFSTISGNRSDSAGGGIIVFGNASIFATTISNNLSGLGGGVALAGQVAQAAFVNSTISGNHAGLCGGIYSGGLPGFYTATDVSLSNSTIAFNVAGATILNGKPYAAGFCGTGSVTMQSALIADNSVHASMTVTPLDFSATSGTSISGESNLIMTTTAGTTAPPGTLTGDPLLGALADNGGPTLTHALLPGSPAIATGNNVEQLASDQRGAGFARMTRIKTDIGALQSGDGFFAAGFE